MARVEGLACAKRGWTTQLAILLCGRACLAALCSETPPISTPTLPASSMRLEGGLARASTSTYLGQSGAWWMRTTWWVWLHKQGRKDVH